MPKKLERALKRSAAKKHGWTQKRKDKYVYGKLRSTGWKPKNQRLG